MRRFGTPQHDSETTGRCTARRRPEENDEATALSLIAAIIAAIAVAATRAASFKAAVVNATPAKPTTADSVASVQDESR